MYKPSGAISLADMKMPQIRLGIQGFPATGKSWAALTFPNCIVPSTDRGLGAHLGRQDVYEVPFYDDIFCKSICPKLTNENRINRREAITKWLDKEATQLSAEQTLVMDNSTGLQSAYDDSYEKQYTKTGAVDDFAFWRLKVEWFSELHTRLKSLKCHVVYICHETPARNKEGDLNGKLRPLLAGQFGDQIVGHYTDWFRQHAMDKPKVPEKIKLEEWGFKSYAEFQKNIVDKFPDHGMPMYVWQLYSDDLVDCKTSSLVNFPKYMKADYDTFVSHMRKPISTTVE